MSGRVWGELVSDDYGLAVAIRRRAYGRWRWELYCLVGPITFAIGFVRVASGHPRAR